METANQPRTYAPLFSHHVLLFCCALHFSTAHFIFCVIPHTFFFTSSYLAYSRSFSSPFLRRFLPSCYSHYTCYFLTTSHLFCAFFHSQLISDAFFSYHASLLNMTICFVPFSIQPLSVLTTSCLPKLLSTFIVFAMCLPWDSKQQVECCVVKIRVAPQSTPYSLAPSSLSVFPPCSTTESLCVYSLATPLFMPIIMRRHTHIAHDIQLHTLQLNTTYCLLRHLI